MRGVWEDLKHATQAGFASVVTCCQVIAASGTSWGVGQCWASGGSDDKMDTWGVFLLGDLLRVVWMRPGVKPFLVTTYFMGIGNRFSKNTRLNELSCTVFAEQSVLPIRTQVSREGSERDGQYE